MDEDNGKFIDLETEVAVIHGEEDAEGGTGEMSAEIDNEENQEDPEAQLVEQGEKENLENKQDPTGSFITQSPHESEPSQATLSPVLMNIPGDAPIIIQRVMEPESAQPASSPTNASDRMSPLLFEEPPQAPVASVPSPVLFAKADISVPSPKNDSSIEIDKPEYFEEASSTLEASGFMHDDVSDDYSREVGEAIAGPSSEIVSPSPAETVLLDDRQHRTWKKSAMLVYNRLINHRHASLFLKPVSEKQAPGYYSIVHRPMDLPTIRRNIRNGVIRTTEEFHRDVLLMFQNALMYNKRNGTVYNMAREMLDASLQEIQVLKDAEQFDAEQFTAARRQTQAIKQNNKA